MSRAGGDVKGPNHTTVTSADTDMFDGGPPLRLLRLWGRFDPEHRHVWLRALTVAAVGWLPLLVLALLSYASGHEGVWRTFLQDASVHARSLVVAPLLVFAEAVCIPHLGAVAQIFRARGLVPASQMQAYEAVVRTIRRLRDWWLMEALAVVLAFIASLLIVRYIPASFLPDWHHGSADAPLGRSFASWWHALISLPLLLVLLLGWCWRIFLWTRYLWLVSRLDLRLVASHPEGAAGLMFVSYSLRAWSMLGFATGVIVAATALAHILAGGPGDPQRVAFLALGTVLFVVVVFTAPLLIFSGPLMRTWRGAVDTYGALAQRVGEDLEDRWMRGPSGEGTEAPLESPDFSATTDLFQVVEKAYALRLAPVDLRSMLLLAGFTALPFAGVTLALVPFDKLLGTLLGLFL